MGESILSNIGNTPLVAIGRLNPNPRVRLLAKLEYMNPGGSIKDRAALAMIAAGEAAGQLRPGRTVIEATSGNTGIGLALVCAVKGYPLLLAMSDAVSVERRKILEARGARILLTPGRLGTDGAIEEVYRLVREKPDAYFMADQYNNPANWRAHLRDHRPGDLGAERAGGHPCGGHPGHQRHPDGHQPASEGVRCEHPHHRRRALPGPQDPGAQEHEGGIPAGDLRKAAPGREDQHRRRGRLRDGPASGPGGGGCWWA